ncbi:MAG: helix-turn-helix domain-containing protein [Gemmatimonadota bacterium]|nr:helix-turn-helix domain-containing protein [Gemmatimonadota bacterium]
MLVGQLTRSAMVGPSGVTDIVGIRFLPWGAAHLLKTRLSELRDALIPLDSVVPGGMEDLADLLSSGPADSWAETAFAYLRNEMPELPERVGLSARAVGAIRAQPGRLGVRALARRLHVGERQLERVMRRDVGLPPSVLGRIFRVQTALRTMRADPARPFSAVALESGYYDHSHFVREFRRVVGCTPSRFLRAEFALTEVFIDGAPPSSLAS